MMLKNQFFLYKYAFLLKIAYYVNCIPVKGEMNVRVRKQSRGFRGACPLEKILIPRSSVVRSGGVSYNSFSHLFYHTTIFLEFLPLFGVRAVITKCKRHDRCSNLQRVAFIMFYTNYG
jgi:hypothetical protein